MTKGRRACPICPSCGSKKFSIVGRNDREMKVTVKCISCGNQITV